MKKNIIYSFLVILTGIFLWSCDDDNKNPVDDKDKDLALEFVVTRLSSYETVETRADINAANPTLSGMRVRSEQGHQMHVTLGENTARYVFRNSMWVPAENSLIFPKDVTSLPLAISINYRDSANIEYQDGTMEGLLKADSLYYSVAQQARRENIPLAIVTHMNALVEIEFNDAPEGEVVVNGQYVCYPIPRDPEDKGWTYQALVPPGDSVYTISLNYYGDVYLEEQLTVEGETQVFEADKKYRIPVTLPKGTEVLEIGNIEVSPWPEIAHNGNAIGTVAATILNIEGDVYIADTLMVSFTDGTPEQRVILDSNGSGRILSDYPAKMVRGIVREGRQDTIYIGRYAEMGKTISFKVVLKEGEEKLDYRMVNNINYISIAHQLINALSSYKNYQQEVDIDMMNYEITKARPALSGVTYDGADLKIYNVNMNVTGAAGFFGGVNSGLKDYPTHIKNVHIVSGTIKGTGHQVGGLIASMSAAGTTNSIENCSNGATVIGGSWYAGGIVGITAGPVVNCVNTGDIIGKDEYTGGIVGAVNGNDAKLIERCLNKGKVYSTGNHAGGIVGGIISAKREVVACINKGEVLVEGSKTMVGVGGIVGVIKTNGKGVIKASYNTGKLSYNGTATGNNLGVGGILGLSDNKSPQIRSNYNIGEIVNGNASGGGIYGAGSVDTTQITHNFWNGFPQGAPITLSKTRVCRFSAQDWPEEEADNNWGVGDGTDGKYWKTLGKFDEVRPIYPVLYWEK